MTQTNRKPAHTIRYGGVHVAIWKNENEKGVNHTVTVERRYFAADQWQSTAGFFREDLLALAKALTEAHTWMYARCRTNLSTPAEETAA